MQDDITGEAFKKVAEATAQQIAIRNADVAETKKVEINV